MYALCSSFVDKLIKKNPMPGSVGDARLVDGD
jgi:hypothetical protein